MSSSDTFSTDALSIAIIGMAGLWPGASSVDALWRNLCDGVEAVTFFSAAELAEAGIDPDLLAQPNYVKAGACIDDVAGFDASFFDYTPREAEAIDPQQRLFLEAAWTALEDAGYPPHSFAGQIGVYAGASVNTYLFNNIFAALGHGSAADYAQIIISSDKDFLATRVSYKLNLRGPSMTVQSACSTSLVAAHLAVQSLLSYQCDLALAGGVSLSFPQRQGYLYQPGGILAPDGHCRPFDHQAAGTLRGNGLGVVVLKRLEEALADGDQIYAVIKGAAVNNDGNLKAGYAAPSEEGQAAVIAAAHALAEVEPDSITYVEAHGTATPIGDPIEVAALTRAFRLHTERTQFCALGSIKSNIGHLDAAAGVSGLIKTALALHHRRIPPSLNFSAPNPEINFASSPFYVNTTLTPWPAGPTPRRAGVSSFGIGGTNVHMILEEAPCADPAPAAAAAWQIVPLSAKTASALETATTQLADHCAAQPDLRLVDVAYTLRERRHAFAQRRVVLARTLQEAQTLLAARDPQRVLSGVAQQERRALAFLFPGAGSQYFNMGHALYQRLPAFRAAVDRCAEIVRPQIDADLRELMYAAHTPTAAQSDAFQQVAAHALLGLFTMEYALAQQWLAWGVAPTLLIGHSLGEYTAACLAETITLEEALALVTLRGKLFDSLPEGSCLSVALAVEELQALLPPDVYLAVINSPSQCVVSGTVAAVAAFADTLAARDISCRLIAFNRAAHSPLLAPILDEFAAYARTITMRQPRIPYISNVTGTWISAAELGDQHYWVRHLESTVRFNAGLETILADPACALLEVGPGQALSALVRKHPQLTPRHAVIASGRHPHDQQPEDLVLLTALGRLWLSGVALDWAQVFPDQGAFVRLPTYPFEHTRYWLAPLGRPASAPPATASSAASSDQPSLSTAYARPNLPTPFVAARSATEVLLARCWGDTIGIDAVGIHDNFFDLGGDSLLALRLTAQLSQVCGVAVEPRMLFERPTIAELAAQVDLLRTAPEDAPAALVRLQPAGARPPFFCVHPSGGLALCYAELARLLGPDQPLYGFQARGIDGRQPPRTSIAAMASSYIDELRSVQPSGPYIIGGWSMGGLIALEMAQQLQQQHEQVALVVLLDTPAQQQGLAPDQLSDAELACAMLGPELGITAAQLAPIAEADRLAHMLELALHQRYFPPEFTLDQLHHFVQMFRTHAQACWDYQPQPYAGAVLLVRASAAVESSALFGFGADAAHDLGWSAYVRGPLTITSVSGNHQTLLHAPHVQAVAHALKHALEHAQREHVAA